MLFGKEEDCRVFWERWCFGHGVPAGFPRPGRSGEWVHEQDPAHLNPLTELGGHGCLGKLQSFVAGMNRAKEQEATFLLSSPK